MDKKGFDLIDRSYQHEMAGHKQKITEKWQGFYANKQYVGTPEMQAKARANDNAQMKQRINAEIKALEQQLGKKHFSGKTREEAFQEIKKQEELKKRTEEFRKQFQRKANDNKRGRGR